MNEHARLWVRVLRSGEFERGERRLRVGDDCYCCLGVACELYRRETGDGEWRPDSDGWAFSVDGDEKDKYPPMPILDWLGLTRASGRRLANVNDVNRSSFAEIADLIESEPEGLFA